MNENGEIFLCGLFVCGEVVYIGVYGVNRLVSNFLFEGIVFARRAVVFVVNEIDVLCVELFLFDVDDEDLCCWFDE